MERETITIGASVTRPGITLRAPVWTVAPMVTQSDAAFRLLTRRHGARLVYSEMLMADEFAADPSYRQTGLGLQGGCVPEADHPLIVQFAANDPEVLLRAALAAQECGADAVDINLGHGERSRSQLAVQEIVSAVLAGQFIRLYLVLKKDF